MGSRASRGSGVPRADQPLGTKPEPLVMRTPAAENGGAFPFSADILQAVGSRWLCSTERAEKNNDATVRY